MDGGDTSGGKSEEVTESIQTREKTYSDDINMVNRSNVVGKKGRAENLTSDLNDQIQHGNHSEKKLKTENLISDFILYSDNESGDEISPNSRKLSLNRRGKRTRHKYTEVDFCLFLCFFLNHNYFKKIICYHYIFFFTAPFLKYTFSTRLLFIYFFFLLV